MASPERRPPPDRDHRPASHLDAAGRRHVAPSWESLVERLIREAMEDGRFDELPHQGERLPIEDDTYAGDQALAFRVLRNAGAAPPWIEADKEVRRLLERRGALFARAASPGTTRMHRERLRNDLVALVRDVNAAIRRLNAQAPTDRQHRRPLDPEAELARFDALS
jgi:DnaJ homolog subfamily C member 28